MIGRAHVLLSTVLVFKKWNQTPAPAVEGTVDESHTWSGSNKRTTDLSRVTFLLGKIRIGNRGYPPGCAGGIWVPGPGDLTVWLHRSTGHTTTSAKVPVEPLLLRQCLSGLRFKMHVSEWKKLAVETTKDGFHGPFSEEKVKERKCPFSVRGLFTRVESKQKDLDRPAKLSCERQESFSRVRYPWPFMIGNARLTRCPFQRRFRSLGTAKGFIESG